MLYSKDNGATVKEQRQPPYRFNRPYSIPWQRDSAVLKEEMIKMNSLLTKFTFTDELTDVIENCKGVFVPTSKAELYDMVFGPEHADVYDVVFDVPGKGLVKEAEIGRAHV